MKVLIVCSINSGTLAPFILEQAGSLAKKGCEMEYFTISGKGFTGYLQNRRKLISKIKAFEPHIIHAHYGLSGLLANLQRHIPVITTYHGSDIHNKKVRRFSKIAIRLSQFNIFVSQKNIDIVRPKGNYALIPCGIDLETFQLFDKNMCREKLGFSKEDQLVLFSGSFTDQVKNSPLAQEALALIPKANLIELKGYDRKQVCQLMNAVDVALMTSITEGSPQFIKEAMACNCPIVSVDVGDVKETMKNTNGCYITSYEAKDIAGNIRKALNLPAGTNGRENLLRSGLDLESIADQVYGVYKKVLDAKSKPK